MATRPEPAAPRQEGHHAVAEDQQVHDDEHGDTAADAEREGQQLERVERAGRRIADVGDTAEDLAVPQGQAEVAPRVERHVQVRTGIGHGVEPGDIGVTAEEWPRGGEREHRDDGVLDGGGADPSATAALVTNVKRPLRNPSTRRLPRPASTMGSSPRCSRSTRSTLISAQTTS